MFIRNPGRGRKAPPVILKIMALYIKANGEARKVTPSRGCFTIAEVQKYVGGRFEPHLLGAGGHTMFINEFGHLLGLAYNDMATACASWLPDGGHVAGDALLVNNDEIKTLGAECAQNFISLQQSTRK